MRNPILSVSSVCLALALVFSGCDEGNEPKKESTAAKYVVLSAADKWAEGYLTSFEDLPSGTVSAISNSSLLVNSSFGFRSYKNWVFARANTAGDVGLQKYTVNADGSFKDAGFIVDASQFVIVDDARGYYLDETRGTLKIQTFNPSAMERTGEIDLSSLRDETVEYQVIGKHTLAVKEGKLYAGITYGTITGQGYADDVVDYIEFAVIDIASNTLDKTITYNDGGLNSIGWGSSGNKMWSLGDDGALYLYSTGLTLGFAKASVIRIKKGETEFDATWRLDAHELVPQSSVATALVRNGKIYLELPSEPLASDFSNLESIIFDYYAVDLETKETTKITGMPQHHFAYANEQAITEVDGKIMFWVRNPGQNIDGYYALNSDGTSATQVFNIAHDGFMWGFVKLEE